MQHPQAKLQEVKEKESQREERRSWGRERDGVRDKPETEREKMRSQEVSISNQRFYCFCY